MAFKSALERLLERIGPAEAKLALSKTDPEAAREGYIAEIRGYQKSVKVVTGEANGKLFGQDALAEALREGLSSAENRTFMLVFHKDDDMKRAEALFETTNKPLLDLKREFPTQVHIWWSPIRPRQHYVVVDDGAKVILEEPNHRQYQPFWAAVVIDADRGKEWAERFNDYIKYCREVEFESAS